MFDNLIKLVKQNAGSAVIDNPNIPNERNDEAVQETGNSIINSLKNALAGGGINNVLDMFSRGKADNNPVVQEATGDLTQKLQNKFGLNTDQASNIAGNLVPNVMNQLAQKTADPSDSSFDIQDIFNNLSGGKTSGMNVRGMLAKFKTGMDKDGDGDVDLRDIQALFSGGGSFIDKMKGTLGV